MTSSHTTTPGRLLTETEAAERLRWRPATLRRRRWAGLPPRFVRIGGSVRYDERVIDAFIAAGLSGPAAEGK